MIDFSEAHPGRWISIGLGGLAALLVAKFAPEMWPVIFVVLPIGYLIHHDESDRKPLWKFRKDRA
jgi:hypothetical protein